MTKKLFALLVAVCVMLSGMAVAFAEEVGSPTDVPEPVYSLTFEANKEGVYGLMDTIYLDAPGKATIPELGFAHDIFDFTGWNTNIDGSGIAYEEGDTIDIDGEVKLYAQWLRKGVVLEEFYITYDANGGEGETIDIFNPYMSGLTASIVDNEFTREGYDFVEWNTEADGSGTSYQPFDSVDIEGDLVLYAIWESNGTLVEDDEEQPGDEDSLVENENEEIEEESEEDIENEEDTVTDTDIPPMGDSTSFAVAAGVCAVAAAAYVLVKKHN
jgi:uncharacterized repeat protein (TIGR02543 family)